MAFSYYIQFIQFSQSFIVILRMKLDKKYRSIIRCAFSGKMLRSDRETLKISN